jgi:glycosyltransferase involved in cell wall biosynthesis
MPPVYLLRQVVFHISLLDFVLRHGKTIDAVLFHQISAPWLLPLRLWRRLTGRQHPLLVMDTRTVPMEHKAKASLKDHLRAFFYTMSNWLANHFVDGQTAITRRMAEVVHIPAHHLWGVWPSAVNVERFAPAQAVRRWPDEGEPVHIIYIGVLSYERNIIEFCQAVEQANAEGMTFRVSLIGSGTARHDLEELAARTAGRVQVVPPVPHSEVPGLLAQAHVGVLPFPDEEKFRVSSPIKLFEYMASGLAVLATRIVCHTDVVGNGDNVIWAEDASVEGLLAALRRTWQARAVLRDMGQRSAEAAQNHTWRESADKLKAALEYGIRAHHKPAPLPKAHK